MAYDRQHLRTTIEFVASGTAEVAQTGFSVTGATGFDAVAALAAITAGDLDLIGRALYDLMSNAPYFRWASYSYISAVKCAAVDTNGRYLGDPRVETVSGTPAIGTVGNVPPQMTVELGLWSGHTVGVANYGKMFLPHCFLQLATGTPTASSGDITSVAGLGAAFISFCNTKFNTGSHPGIVANLSRKTAAVQTKGVTYVRVANINDTQRRRYGQLGLLRGSAAV